jgi:hypothetical protein
MKKVVLALPLIALMAGGCASVSAKAKDAPALNVPPAPPRVLEPVPDPPPEPVAELPATAPATPPNTTAPRPNRGRENRPPATPDPKAGEQKPLEPVTPPDPVPPPPAQPPAQLQTPQTADTNSVRAVRAMIDRAYGLLNGIDYRQLPDVRKKAYDDAKRFAAQADVALKEGNVVFAQAVAAKAETLAKELAGR